MENKEIVLSVKDLKVNFSTDHGYVQAVRGVSFDLYKGETLCIVGESGSGKSVTSKTIMGILSANGRIMGGSIMYQGEDLTKISEDEFHRIRGHKIGMIFQDPLSSLNPIVRIGKQITEAMLVNNNRLKKRYDDLVAPELTAYRNAKTEYERLLVEDKERRKFLKAEKKKDLTKIKNDPPMFKDGKLYTLRLEYQGKILEAKDIYKEKVSPIKEEIAALEKEDPRINELQNQIEVYKKELDEEINRIKEYRVAQLEIIKKEYAEDKEKAKVKKEETIQKYDTLLNDLNEKASLSKSELKQKYVPLIKSTKELYLARSKTAKEEVKEYARDLKEKYLAKVEEIKAQNLPIDEEKKLIEKAKSDYVSKVKITKGEAKAKALRIMKEVGISNPEKRFRQYPFEFSGGMRQRIVIAIALTADPDILICDEPTTALDVTIQAQILELINRLKAERNISVIFITHDLGVVANMADRVAVMYAGKIVEYGTEEDIFYNPKHPYTWALLSSIPDINSKEKLEAIPGTPPNMIYPPVGDAFALRSKYAMAIDFKKEPPMFKVSDTHYAATWLLDPRAPKVEMPKIVKTRIENSLKAAKGGNK